ncbi:MAG: hypothetical protein ICV60_05585 [Pyrinomonadaceae bacterium]|nr:hypothetical protein [Pyrinomonadaceae bacterium]
MSAPPSQEQTQPDPSQKEEALVSEKPATPTPESLLSLLDFEIEELENENKRSGWSQWAILAAIAGALWLLTDELKAASFNTITSLKIFLGGIALADLLSWIYRGFTFSSQSIDEEPRFYSWRTLFSNSRMQSAFELLRAILLITLALLGSTFSWPLLALFIFSYGVWGAANLLPLLLPILKPDFIQPVDLPKPAKVSAIIWGLLLTVPMLVFLALLFASLPHPLGTVISDFRVGGLLAIASYLLVILMSVLTTPSKLLPLINLRRRFVLGKISLNEAILQTEIILGGMTAVDALRDSFFNLIFLVDRINEQIQNATVSVQAMEANIPDSQNEDKTIVDDKKKTLISIEGGYRYFIGERDKYVELFKKQLDSFYKDARSIVRNMPAGRPAVNQMEQLLRSRIELSDKQYFNLEAMHQEIVKQIEAGISDKQNKAS